MQNSLVQLPLGLNVRDEAVFDNFYPGKNNEILLEMQKTASGCGEKLIYVSGTRGEGLSHLLKASCHFAYQHDVTSVYLPMQQIMQYSPEILTGLESLSLICIDDLHVIAKHPQWEEALFHLYNRVYDAGGSMIITAHDLPKSIHLQLPDLISRLSWGIIYQLHPLTDEEKLLVLMQRANYRGIPLPEEVGKYMMTHCKRHMGALFSALDHLDEASLAAKRRLTIPFVKEVLQL